MIYIKLNDDLSLVITANGTIHAGDNMSQKITYLVPKKVNEVDMATAYVYLCYVCADGSSDMVLLNRADEMYNQTYYQYVTDVKCRLTKFPGEVRTWLSITTGDNVTDCDCAMSAKSGECILRVEGREDSSCCCPENTLTVLTQMQTQLDAVQKAQAELDIGAAVEAEIQDYDFDPVVSPLVDDAVEAAVAGLDSRYDSAGAAAAVQEALSNELGTFAQEVATDIQELRAMIEAASTLPPVSTDDNGKFMRVVDGVWVAANLTDVSQEGM